MHQLQIPAHEHSAPSASHPRNSIVTPAEKSTNSAVSLPGIDEHTVAFTGNGDASIDVGWT
jgi:hypothetical protein